MNEPSKVEPVYDHIHWANKIIGRAIREAFEEPMEAPKLVEPPAEFEHSVFNPDERVVAKDGCYGDWTKVDPTTLNRLDPMSYDALYLDLLNK